MGARAIEAELVVVEAELDAVAVFIGRRRTHCGSDLGVLDASNPFQVVHNGPPLPSQLAFVCQVLPWAASALLDYRTGGLGALGTLFEDLDELGLVVARVLGGERHTGQVPGCGALDQHHTAVAAGHGRTSVAKRVDAYVKGRFGRRRHRPSKGQARVQVEPRTGYDLVVRPVLLSGAA